VIQEEVKRGIVHPEEQLIHFGQNGLSLTPGQNGGKKTGNLNILSSAKAMGYGNGIRNNECRLIEMADQLIQVHLQVIFAFG
jgi:hypothetical protein